MMEASQGHPEVKFLAPAYHHPGDPHACPRPMPGSFAWSRLMRNVLDSMSIPFTHDTTHSPTVRSDAQI